MKIKHLSIILLTIGVASLISLIYFYFLQKEFTKNHREFLISVNQIHNYHDDLTTSILKSSLYTYHNQDEIALNSKRLLKEYEKIANAKILKNTTYRPVIHALSSLKEEIDENLGYIQEYMMLNAAVKNSLVFLSRHVDNAASEHLDDEKLLIDARKILKRYQDAKSAHDLDYLNNGKYLLSSKSDDTKTKEFVDNFNLHSNYLIGKYPKFLKTTKLIINSDIHNRVEDVREMFSKLSLNDFKAFDNFAFILFGIFIFSLFFIITLFIKYLEENKKLLKTKDSLEHALTYDHLTNLYNRKAFGSKLSTLESPHILIINIDSFKHINDIYGNEVGNSLLKEMALFIKNMVGNIENAKVYRLGGDEFCILFDFIDTQSALQIAQKIEDHISKHTFVIDSLELNIFVSIASNNIEPILENADLALKMLKSDNTKRIIQYKEDFDFKMNLQKNMEIINILKNAIKDDRVVPYFQPIVDLSRSRIIKYEALARIILEDGSVVTPDKFIEISKKTPYYHEITKMILDKTLKAAAKYPKYRFSVNISMIDIMSDSIVNIILSMLQKNLSAATRLDIELLESENMHDISKVQEFIKDVKKYGCKILIDDFGSGYSNFSHFSSLDVDLIKIDGSIVKEIMTDEKKLHIFKSIHEFSKGMSLPNVAEFVETQEISTLLQEIGIEYAQGYYFSKPLAEPLENDEVTI